MPERELVEPEGDALDWTDEELDALTNISPYVVADARVDARQFPVLYALLTAPLWQGEPQSGVLPEREREE